MPRRLISSGSPFETTLGYSRAIVQGDWCFVSGTTGYDPQTREMPQNIADQTRNILQVIEAALVEGGFTRSDMVKMTYYLTDAALMEEVAPVLGEFFAEVKPAATMVICDLIKPEMKIEIEATAFRG